MADTGLRVAANGNGGILQNGAQTETDLGSFESETAEMAEVKEQLSELREVLETVVDLQHAADAQRTRIEAVALRPMIERAGAWIICGLLMLVGTFVGLQYHDLKESLTDIKKAQEVGDSTLSTRLDSLTQNYVGLTNQLSSERMLIEQGISERNKMQARLDRLEDDKRKELLDQVEAARKSLHR
jgi:hypothetical protein